MSIEINSSFLECGEEIINLSLCSQDDKNFNEIIGCIEDMFISDDFLEKQKSFLDKYWTEFEDSEENKLEYMNIFKKYQDEIEEYLEHFLKKTLTNFDMVSFIEELQDRKDQLNGEIFEVLFTLTDFLVFKEMFLDYKAMKEGRTIDLTNDVFITKINTNLY